MPIGALIGSIVNNNPTAHATLSGIGAHAMANQAQAAANIGMSNPWTGVSGCSGVGIVPFYRDPLEYATETALAQPSDKAWRRFQHAIFRVADVITFSAEGSGSICVQLRLEAVTRQEVFTLPFECDDSVQWFAEHVMGFEFPNAKHAT